MDLIENYIKKDEIDWHLHLSWSLIKQDNISGEMKNRIDFMLKRLDFFYGDNLYQKNPFQPMFEWSNGQRSTNVEDLTEEDLIKIKELKEYTKEPILLGKIYDIIWIKENKMEDAFKTSEIYFNYFLKNRLKKMRSEIFSPLQRSLYILCELKNDSQLKLYIDKILNLKKYQDKDDKIVLFYYIADLLNKNNKKILNYYINKFKNVFDSYDSCDDLTLETIEILLDYYKSKGDLKNIDKYKMKYVKVCEEIEKIQSPHGHQYLTRAIEILDPKKHELMINDLMIKRDESQRKMYNSFQMKKITLTNDEVNKNIQVVRENVVNNLKKMNSVQQFVYLLKEFNPVSEESIKKQIRDMKKHSALVDFIPKVVFGENGTIVYDESKATESEKQEYKYAEQYKLSNSIKFMLILEPYIYERVLDEDLEYVIKEIVKHNLFVPKDRINKVIEDILNILGKKIRLGLFDLITQFENGCRKYLRDQKNLYPAVLHGSKYDEINLNNILVKKQKENKFRNAMCEVLGSDFVLELEYLLCRPLSSDIRNRYVHDGCGNYDEFSIDEAVAAFLLLKAYCFGYDDEINKDD